MLGVIKFLLLFVEALTCLLLLVVILMQRTKGQGMGMAFGGGMGEAIFGSRMGNVLTKTTVVLGIVFLVNTTFLAMLSSRHSRVSVVDAIPTAVAQPAMPMPSETSGAAPGDLPAADFGVPASDVPADAVTVAVPAADVPAETVPVPAPSDVPAVAVPVPAEGVVEPPPAE